MLSLAEYIKDFRKKNKLTQQQFADRCGLSNGFISQLENDYRPGKNKERMLPNMRTMKALAQGMGIDLNDLLSSVNTDINLYDNGSEDPVPSFKGVPRYALICCGNGGFVDDNILDYISLPSSWLSASKEYFAQTASGDSMEGAGIYDGDILVFEKVSTPQQGRIGCFCIDDNEAMCKKYRVAADGRIYLMPANPNYDPIPVDPGMEHFRCLGLLAFVISDRRK
ncbi:MAG: XRE family transcriptional regulator [Stecheria intestinalis]|jgi:repressor LexA|uniref:LexA family protein n=1 Tax=Stecheria intestinalis TaxID=2606630 RepID=UPI0023F3EC39|nr:XRE family transcriptional regulator [Stecheria intestinalis]MDD5881455.1 XRE family transcriptional regulator [Stecheria intestinalis]MDD6366965.1 XRE family transcriptional regulator [Stecheria intestinalis]